MEKNGDCYFERDLEFLQALIDNSQNSNNSPSKDLDPLNLGWQRWENGRLVK